MKQEIFIHYGNRLMTKSKRSKRALLKAIVKSKINIIESADTTIHYTKEIRLQAKVFKNNIITNQINKYDYERSIIQGTKNR